MADDKKKTVVVAKMEPEQALYTAMVKIFLEMAARRLLSEEPPKLTEGDPYVLTYTATFRPQDIALLCKKLNIELPKIRLIMPNGSLT